MQSSLESIHSLQTIWNSFATILDGATMFFPSVTTFEPLCFRSDKIQLLMAIIKLYNLWKYAYALLDELMPAKHSDAKGTHFLPTRENS